MQVDYGIGVKYLAIKVNEPEEFHLEPHEIAQFEQDHPGCAVMFLVGNGKTTVFKDIIDGRKTIDIATELWPRLTGSPYKPEDGCVVVRVTGLSVVSQVCSTINNIANTRDDWIEHMSLYANSQNVLDLVYVTVTR